MSFALVPAAYVLLVRGDGPIGPDTEVLLQKRGPGTTYLPGHWAAGAAGHVEPGESVFEAAAREAREELDIEVGPLEPLCVLHRTLPGNSAPIEQRVDFFFTVRTWHGDPRIVEPTKCSELAWRRLSDLPEPMTPHEFQVLTRLTAGPIDAFATYGFPDHEE